MSGQRLLEPGRVRLLGHGHQRQVVVPHVVPADHVRAVGQAVGVPVVRRAQQQGRGVHRAAATTTTSALKRDRRPVAELGDDRGDGPPARVGLQPRDVRAGDQRDVVVLQRRVDADHLGVGLAVRAGRGSRRPGHSGCTRCRGWRRPCSSWVRSHADRQVERVQALLLQVVAELLDPRLVLDRRVRGTARWPAPRWGPRRAGRARRRGARPGCSTARGRHSRSARPGRSRRGAGARRSPAGAAGTAPRRRTWCCRRRSS